MKSIYEFLCVYAVVFIIYLGFFTADFKELPLRIILSLIIGGIISGVGYSSYKKIYKKPLP